VNASAVLVLEDGRTFTGEPFGAVGNTFGEAVFFTGTTGYQEALTDPSYHRQIVVMTAPHIGNTGMNDADPESDRIWVSGYVVRDPARTPSNWRSRRGLDRDLRRSGVVGISRVDTRAITRHLRGSGTMRAGIFSGPKLSTLDEMTALVQEQPSMSGADLTDGVTTAQPYSFAASGKRFSVVAVDLGIKTNIVRALAARGAEVHVVPATVRAKDVLRENPDGVLLSNGPGDPATAWQAIKLTQALLARQVPLFGICFGHQVLGRALGFRTYKLGYGHRGVNQPVRDQRSGKVQITAHNHGFAVAAPPDRTVQTPFGRVEASHICLNDNVIEGLRCLDTPAFSVQYHPEAAAGPHDAAHLFDEFFAAMEAGRA
jgi:carbamoyl-phosphate synthase small subunit